MALGVQGVAGKIRARFWRIRDSIQGGDSDSSYFPESKELLELEAPAGKPSAPRPPTRSGKDLPGIGGPSRVRAQRAQWPQPPQPRITHQRCCLAHHVSATGSGLLGKEAHGEESACPLALELPSKEGRRGGQREKKKSVAAARAQPRRPTEAGPARARKRQP